jgi:hypothetical protein
MDSILTAPAQLARPHALPFRTLFEEHLRRGGPARPFTRALETMFPPTDGAGSVEQLDHAIRQQEKAYAELNEARQAIAAGKRLTGTDQELSQCVAADAPLKKLLHQADASALCLSGGGIRSASYCLGVLEGLARFSRSSTLGASGRLMDGLDYLSTVSGGGYIGSWLMSWTYRRMAAARTTGDLAEAAGMTSECIERAQALCLKAQGYLIASGVGVGDSDAPPAGPLKEAAAFKRQIKALRGAIDQGAENARLTLLLASRNGDAAVDSAVLAHAAQAERALRLAHTALVRGADAALAGDSRLAEPRAENARGRRAWSVMWQETKDSLEDSRSLRAMLDRAPDALHRDFDQASSFLGLALHAIRTLCTPDWRAAYAEVIGALAGGSSVTSGDPEPQPVEHLRSYTSFLAPELGATLDTATLAAIILRNLIVNWAMLIPVLFVLIAAIRALGFFTVWASIALPDSDLLPVGIGFGFLLAAAAAAAMLPSHHALNQTASLRKYPVPCFVLPVFLASWLLVAAWTDNGEVLPWTDYLWSPPITPIALAAFAVLGASLFWTYSRRVTGRMLSQWRGRISVGVLIALTAVVSSFLLTSLMVLLQQDVFPRLTAPGTNLSDPRTDPRIFLIFSLPLVSLALMTSCSLFCALLGIYEMEEDREWWVRCGGCLLAADLFWMVGQAVTLYGTAGWAKVVGLAGLAIGAAGSFLGYSTATAAGTGTAKASQLSGVGKFLNKHHLMLPAISSLAIGLIGIGMVALEEAIRRHHLYGFTPAPANEPALPGLLSALQVLGVAAVLTLLLNWGININLFSLQGMYRMRLMRAFLGASNSQRRPDPFTNFDPRDTPYETDLPKSDGAPLHLINTTLNLVGTTNPAWRQRKAESFTFSPIHAGSWRLGYVPANLYGGGRGVTLATAMAISGAAFNPNMGYQSSPLLALLMTFFNLRLGYWLPNPKRPTSRLATAAKDSDFYSKAGPSFALYPLIEEALGKTNDTSRWIELTDGGHFDNLGLYEMVLRRVKHIIVVDAGADPECQFEDLGNAIRKIQIDLGIPIEFEHDDLKMVKGMKLKNSYCAVARISYHCVDPLFDGLTEDALDGTLIYLKASLTGREPADVLQYAKTHSTFPHESTADQFFNEPQFESYRHLGSFAVQCIEDRARARDGATPFAVFLDAARALWQQPNLPETGGGRPEGKDNGSYKNGHGTGMDAPPLPVAPAPPLTPTPDVH